VKLGIGLPNTMAYETDRALLLAWARTADEAGFHGLSVIDKPNYDSWDPLITLAAAAAVTERARLVTGILQLPNRNEVLVAKQAAVIDRLSEGRLELGLALGGRADDYEVFRAPLEGRARRFARQVARIRSIWGSARKADRDHGALGPAPVQDPGPPILIGAMSEKGVARAIKIGDGFIFGTAGVEMMGAMAPQIRASAEAEGKPGFQIAGLAYVAVGDDPAKALEEAAHHVLRYYGQLWTTPEQLIHHGPPEVIADAVTAYAQTGIDALYLVPQIPSLEQVERLAEEVLPAFR